MIIDFNNDSHKIIDKYDYCIAGAGAAGITLALKLAKNGKRIALFEGGDKEYSQVSQDIYKGNVTSENPYWLDTYRLRFLGVLLIIGQVDADHLRNMTLKINKLMACLAGQLASKK